MKLSFWESLALSILLQTLPTTGQAQAQVVAKQGEKKAQSKPEVVKFESPMLLELPASDIFRLPIGEPYYLKDIHLYECEGVSFRQVRLLKQSESTDRGTTFSIDGILRNAESERAEVSIEVGILGNGQVLTTSILPKILVRGGALEHTFMGKVAIETRAYELAHLSETKILRLTLDVSIAGVKEADETRVFGCELLGTITGHSGWGGLAAPLGAKGAIKSAKKKAAKMGATHIVFSDVDGGGNAWAGGRSTARAYRCSKDQ